MKKFNIHNEYSVIAEQKNKLKQVRLGLPRTKFVFQDIELNSFSFFHLNFFGKAILNNLEEVEFLMEWNYKPQFVAEEFLGDPRLHHIILFANGITSIEEFTSSFIGFKVKIPRKDVLDYITTEIRRMNMKEKKEEILDEKFGEREDI